MRRSTPRPTARRLTVVAAAVGVALSGALVQTALAAPADRPSTPPPGAPLTGMKILLSNDDSARGRDTAYGTDGKGLYELRRALCAAGADVLVVAPWSQQSGASARMTTPGFSPVALTVHPVTVPASYAGDCGGAPSAGPVFGVCLGAEPCTSTSASASPADAVSVALSRFAATYWPQGPDVVLSGTNFGQNVGSTVNHSGTVGAAITAGEYDVPAIAVSAEVPREDLSQIPNMPFAEAAETTVRLLTLLDRQRALREDLVLNVNQPFVGADEELGDIVRAGVGLSSDLGLTFGGVVTSAGGTYQLTAGAPQEETRRNADTSALVANDIPVTALDGDWGTSAPRLFARLLAALR